MSPGKCVAYCLEDLKISKHQQVKNILEQTPAGTRGVDGRFFTVVSTTSASSAGSVAADSITAAGRLKDALAEADGRFIGFSSTGVLAGDLTAAFFSLGLMFAFAFAFPLGLTALAFDAAGAAGFGCSRLILFDF